MNIRLLIADDHQVLREGLCSMLEKQPDIEVIAQAEDGQEAVKKTRELSPDLVLLDVTMPRLDGIDAAREIMKHKPDTKIIALSMHPERAFMYEMFRVGARAYLLKSSGLDELVRAIHTVMEGQVYLSPQIAHLVVSDFMHQNAPEIPTARGALTARELEVLQLLAEGKSVKEIAYHLSLSGKTIETHRQKIMKKLDIHTAADLIKFAVREGLTSL